MTDSKVAKSKTLQNLRWFYPEVGAGGFSRVDGSVAFYTRIHSLLNKDMTVLDLGAGRGGQIDGATIPFLKDLLTLKGKVKKLIGLDVDDAVLKNPFLDEAKVFDPAEPLPFEDGQFDLIFADWVLEHVVDPARFSGEVERLLKPGGWFCARTPNRWGMTGIATNIVPSKYHPKIVGKLQPGRKEFDVFPTCYKLNSMSMIARHFPDNKFENYTYTHNAEPPYVQRSRAAIGAVLAYFRLAPPRLATNLFVFLRKR